MSEITKITDQKRRGHYNIFIDGTYAFPVSETTLVDYRLAKGMVLTAETIAQIKSSEVTAMGLEIGLTYISHQSRTSKEVSNRLAKEDLPADVIQKVLTRLTDLGFLDDADYTHRYIEEHLKMGELGPRTLQHKLQQKGLKPDLLANELAAIPTTAWLDAAVRAGQKNLRHHQHRAYKDQLQCLRVALIQKGFDDTTIQTAIATIDLQPDPEAESDLLKLEAAKQWRLKAKYDDRERKQKVKTTLFRKGFDVEAIDEVLDDLVES